MLLSALQRRNQLRSLYGFDFPDDLFRFWTFANRLRPLDPLTAFAETLGIRLVGPFEVLAGRFDDRSPRFSPLLHWRYSLDPPEFFTVFAGDSDKLHWGYYLDDPGCSTVSAGCGTVSRPCHNELCVASYYASDAFELSVGGDDLFQAVRLEVEAQFHDCEEYLAEDPEHAADYEARLARLEGLRRAVRSYATADRPENGERYVEKYQSAVARAPAVIARTPDGMGVVAPPETYRPLSLSDKKLRSLLRKHDDPGEIVEEARQALRDGFPATALKLGKEMWPQYGERKTAYGYELLDAAYKALGREVLGQVLHAHRENRNLPSVDVFFADV
ncbi:MAG TPA: hypothetical protein DDY78_28320 [Planctomycetales bacterium]|jgi:hypothetical protein|nr:hypothetical protein [Planctomycetales bacterium]